MNSLLDAPAAPCGCALENEFPPDHGTMCDECCESADDVGDALAYSQLTRKWQVLDARFGRCGAACDDTFQIDRALASLIARRTGGGAAGARAFTGEL